jgi:hypothetical protein
MSEYQYYEFLALDRKLTAGEMRELRAVSTRADITATRFVNEYHWGDFKGDPRAWVERYFDAFLYLANWGTRELLFRLPPGSLDPETAEWYCPGHPAEAEGDPLILSFTSDQDGGDDEWVEPGGLLASIAAVRAEIAGGDHRALYLAWLLCAGSGELDYEEAEPPVPPGLGELSPAQHAFADFLRIDPDLISAAAERSAAAAPADDAAELLRRFRAARGGEAAAEPRTVAELLEAAERSEAERLRREKEQATRERARRERAAAAALDRRLAALAEREDASWRRVDALAAFKSSAAYDEAARLVADLREIAVRAGRADEAQARIAALRRKHSRKWSFVRRLDVAAGR